MRTENFSPRDMGNDLPVILFVGDHACFSHIYLRLVRDEVAHFDVVCARHIEEAERVVAEDPQRIAFIIMGSGFGARALVSLSQVKDRAPKVRAVLAYENLAELRRVLTSDDGFRHLEELSFLPMRTKVDATISILQLLISGEQYVSGDVMQILLDQQSGRTKSRGNGSLAGSTEAGATTDPNMCSDDMQGLTARETQVLALLSKGAPNKIIAERLTLSQSTVKLHIHHIIAKLGVRNRTEAAVTYLGANAVRQGDTLR